MPYEKVNPGDKIVISGNILLFFAASLAFNNFPVKPKYSTDSHPQNTSLSSISANGTEN